MTIKPTTTIIDDIDDRWRSLTTFTIDDDHWRHWWSTTLTNDNDRQHWRTTTIKDENDDQNDDYDHWRHWRSMTIIDNRWRSLMTLTVEVNGLKKLNVRVFVERQIWKLKCNQDYWNDKNIKIIFYSLLCCFSWLSYNLWIRIVCTSMLLIRRQKYWWIKIRVFKI